MLYSNFKFLQVSFSVNLEFRSIKNAIEVNPFF